MPGQELADFLAEAELYTTHARWQASKQTDSFALDSAVMALLRTVVLVKLARCQAEERRSRGLAPGASQGFAE